jgi:hypothetical protein
MQHPNDIVQASMARRQKIWHSIACFACAVVLWIHLNDFGASEFSGGRLTAPLTRMAEMGSLLFVIALLLTFPHRRFAATIALAATLLCLPLYLYVLMPGLYGWILKGEYSVTIDRPFHWNNWAVVGILSLLFVAILSFRIYSKNEFKSLGHKE